jgi:hypothetical protein
MARTSSLRAHTWGCEVQLPQPPGKLLAHVLAIEHHYHLLVRLLQKNCVDVLLQSVTMEKNEVHCCHQHAVTCGVASLRRVQTVVRVPGGPSTRSACAGLRPQRGQKAILGRGASWLGTVMCQSRGGVHGKDTGRVGRVGTGIVAKTEVVSVRRSKRVVVSGWRATIRSEFGCHGVVPRVGGNLQAL